MSTMSLGVSGGKAAGWCSTICHTKASWFEASKGRWREASSYKPRMDCTNMQSPDAGLIILENLSESMKTCCLYNVLSPFVRSCENNWSGSKYPVPMHLLAVHMAFQIPAQEDDKRESPAQFLTSNARFIGSIASYLRHGTCYHTKTDKIIKPLQIPELCGTWTQLLSSA